MKRKLLIVGYGSIGARHARLAAALNADVACVTARDGVPWQSFQSLANALVRYRPDHVLIANATAGHAQTLRELERAGFPGGVLVEKPVFATLDDTPSLPGLNVFVAYNLRFHPLIQRLRESLLSRRLYSASFYAGHYLPQWRPERDYRLSYSTRRSQGGGVLRDLSHEIDLALWLCGPAQRISAIGGHFSDLEIDSDDIFSTLAVHERCSSVSISLNYLDRVPRRVIVINAEGLSVQLDLVAGLLTLNGEADARLACSRARDQTYAAQLQAFFANDASTLCGLDEGRDVVRFIAAAESAAAMRCWTYPGAGLARDLQ